MTNTPPPQHSVFAVWRWKWRVWGAIAVACMIYPLTAAPIVYGLERFGYHEDKWMPFVGVAYAPLLWAEHELPVVQELLVCEQQAMAWLFGPLPARSPSPALPPQSFATPAE